jgi:AhpD family alkylhydroperoxidase
MQARMKNPAVILPDAMQAMMALKAAAEKGGVPAKTIDIVHLRASQINGCSLCVDMHARMLKKAGETDERLFSVVAWRDAPYFTDAERAALELPNTLRGWPTNQIRCRTAFGRKPLVITTRTGLRRYCWLSLPSTSGTG